MDWDQLPESLKESSRRHADDIEPKLAAIGYGLAANSAGTRVTGFSDDEVELLARREHERWCAERRDADWSLGRPSDAERRKTPWLLAWDELPEAQRETDRALVRAIPSVVAAAGLAVVRTGSSAAEEVTSKSDRVSLSDRDLPSLFRGLDQRAGENQASFYRSAAVRLMLLVGAAAAGILLPARAGGVVAAAVFVTVLLLEVRTASPPAVGLWVNSRVLAEETRSLAWRYAVGGKPFAVGGNEPRAGKDRLLNELERISRHAEAEGINLGPVEGEARWLSPAMARLRASSWEERRTSYAQERLEPQRDWYGEKQLRAHARARQWWNVAVVVQLAGVVAALLVAAGTVSVSVVGLASTVAAAAEGWSETRGHARVAREYGAARERLIHLRERLDDQREESWPGFVDLVEDALLAENRGWAHERNRR